MEEQEKGFGDPKLIDMVNTWALEEFEQHAGVMEDSKLTELKGIIEQALSAPRNQGDEEKTADLKKRLEIVEKRIKSK